MRVVHIKRAKGRYLKHSSQSSTMSKVNRAKHQATSDFSIARILSNPSISTPNSFKSGVNAANDPLLKNDAAIVTDSHFKRTRSRLPASDNSNDSDASQSTALLSRRFRSDSVELREKLRDIGSEDIGSRACAGDSTVSNCPMTVGSVDRRDLTWLQYTRYRPPRLPRRSLGGKQTKRRPGLHPRIPFSNGQLQTLEDRYRRSAYLSRRDVMEICASLHLPQSRVKIWFQNRRARDRRESHRCS